MSEPHHPHATVRTREQVAELLALGLSRAEIARRLGISKATVSYHARRLGQSVDARCARRYDWAAVQAYYDQGHSVRECQRAFGFSMQSLHAARRRGDFSARPAAMPIDELLARRGARRTHVKARLVREGLLPEACEQCGISAWRGLPLSLELHHRNGDGADNRLENLQILCPNCHSQTDSWGGRNRRAAGRATPVEGPPGGAGVSRPG